MEYNLNTKGNECSIKFTGPMGIAQANEVKAALVNSLSSCSRVTMDLRDVHEMDMSIVQLFCSANMSFEKSGKYFSITDKDMDSVTSLLTELGYDNNFGCSENPCKICLWKGEA
ncbi:MAG: STAS domain-containing protein [Desulfobacteraceae bacterium]|nr:STAS domain-containing protein [Desulfobacteraceae bacterium]